MSRVKSAALFSAELELRISGLSGAAFSSCFICGSLCRASRAPGGIRAPLIPFRSFRALTMLANGTSCNYHKRVVISVVLGHAIFPRAACSGLPRASARLHCVTSIEAPNRTLAEEIERPLDTLAALVPDRVQAEVAPADLEVMAGIRTHARGCGRRLITRAIERD